MIQFFKQYCISKRKEESIKSLQSKLLPLQDHLSSHEASLKEKELYIESMTKDMKRLQSKYERKKGEVYINKHAAIDVKEWNCICVNLDCTCKARRKDDDRESREVT